MKKHILSNLALALCIAITPVALSGCESTTSNSATTDRSQLLLVSSEQVNQEAAQAYSQVLAEAKAQNLLNTDPKLTARVRKVANRLITKAPYYRPDSKDWKWEVNVIKSDTINAWCMAGGKIAVYSALVKELKLTDDELATVMGHEIAHALRDHVREQQSTETLKQGAFAIASVLGVDSQKLQIGNTLANIGLSLPFSREHENEADALGLELMYDAGYNPDAAVSLWKKMSALSGGQESKIQELLSTHPSDSKRIANLEALSAQLKATKPRKK